MVPRIHPSAIIEDDVKIGEGSSIWDNCHVRHGASIGSETIIGEKTYVAYDVSIGNRVKINAFVYVCAGVKIEDMCMISAGTIFTNDRFPRAMNRELTALETSDPTEETLETIVKKGTAIGAGAIIGPGIELGEFSMVGMGAVVTKNVPAQALVVGNPAKIAGYVCICGPRLFKTTGEPDEGAELTCKRCRRKYSWINNTLKLIEE